MMRPRRAQSARDGTAVWLGAAAALLLCLAAAFLAQVHNHQMQTLREQAARTRAQLMAQSIGQRLANATTAGIPLQQLVGVPEFLDRWHSTHPEVTQIAVHDLNGQLLWRSEAKTGPSELEVSAGRADVEHAGVPQARVSLALHNGNLQGAGPRLSLLAPAVLLVSALAYLGALFACAQGPWLRNHGLRVIARWAMRGDYRCLLVLPQRKPFDLRVQEVAHAMRALHERMARMRLLIGSLRRTEPQQLRRDYLDQVLQQTESRDHFGNAEQGMVRLVAVQSQSLWMALLLCLGALGPLTYALRVFAQTADRPGPWQQALPAACLALLVLAAAAGWRLGAGLRLATLSVLILSQAALLLPPLALLLGSAPHPGWIAAWNGGFAGAAMAACTRAQTYPDMHPGFAHVQPCMPGAALLAWWGGLLWLAPALGYYAHAALRPTWAVLALLLPMVCGLFFATRWDVAHSPWRIRMAAAPASSPRQPANAWRWQALGLALGLVAGPMLLGLSATAAAASLLQQCALGIGLALVWAGPRVALDAARPSQRRWQLLALAGITLQLVQLGARSWPATWQEPWMPMLEWLQPLASLLLGMLLAHGLAQATQTPQEATSQRLLLGSAFGAGVSTIAIAVGLDAWPALLALLLLAPLPAAHAKGPDVS